LFEIYELKPKLYVFEARVNINFGTQYIHMSSFCENCRHC